MFVKQLGDILGLGDELDKAHNGTLRDTAFDWDRIGLTVCSNERL